MRLQIARDEAAAVEEHEQRPSLRALLRALRRGIMARLERTVRCVQHELMHGTYLDRLTSVYQGLTAQAAAPCACSSQERTSPLHLYGGMDSDR